MSLKMVEVDYRVTLGSFTKLRAQQLLYYASKLTYEHKYMTLFYLEFTE